MSKGIIISGGGRYLLCALVNIKILRGHGCDLPIELWHFKNERLPSRAEGKLKTWGVRCRELPELPIQYACKPYAVAYTEFDEVLVLDADNTPIRNPDYLFESSPYQDTGAVFWPDFEMAPANEAWSKLANLPEPIKTRQQESGQLLIDRKRCAKAIEKTLEFNLNYDETSQWLWGCKGDKDTFQLAWYAVRQPFHMIPELPGSAGQVTDGVYRSNSLVQHDTYGRPLFMHKNANKWHLSRKASRSWDRFIFAKDPKGEDVHITLSGDSQFHTHEILPKERTYEVDAEKIIAGLETQCLNKLNAIRKTFWYQQAVFKFYFRDYTGRLLKRK